MTQTGQEKTEPQPVIDPLLSLLALVRQAKDIKIFWREFVRGMSSYLQAEQALLLLPSEEGWQVAQTDAGSKSNWFLTQDLTILAQRADAQGLVLTKVDSEQGQVLALKLDVGSQEPAPVLLLKLTQEQHRFKSSELLLLAKLPSFFQIQRQYRQSRADVVFFAEILKLTGEASKDEQFSSAAMRLCNSIATLFHCDQVSLGWKQFRSLHLQAISNVEKFEKRARSVWELEAAMEESTDQNGEVLWPSQDGHLYTKAHEIYAGVRRIEHLITLPLRYRGNVVGALTCERAKMPFSNEEVWRLRLLLEQCSPWMAVHEQQSQWWGRRLYGWLRQGWGQLLQRRYWLIIVLLLLGGLLFATRWSHYVEGTFVLQSANRTYISAPVDGFIKDAPVKPGDVVKAGDILVELDARELLMQQTAALAKLARHQREAEKAEANHALADMRIAQLQAQETEAQVARLAFQLQNSKIQTTFDGVVAEGDLRARLGAPVKQGQTIMTLASLEHFFLEIYVDEADLRYISLLLPVELTYVGKPDLHYRAKLEAVVPQAVVESGGNRFLLRAQPCDTSESWWRPGMSGVVRIKVGEQSPWWLLTHETLDYLRLKFWF